MFTTTQWTVVFDAAKEDSKTSRPALNALLDKYWKPLYFYARHTGLSASDAEDATQSFMTELVQGSFIEKADPARGRFRSYLLTAWKRHLIDMDRTQRRQKRGGDVSMTSIYCERGESEWLARASVQTQQADPDQFFVEEWATNLVREALTRLEREYGTSQRGAIFQSLKGFLTVPIEQKTYEAVAKENGLSAGAAKVALHRLRQRFAQTLREVVQETVDDPEDVQSELDELFASMRRS
jgi:RNA polymerase sigma factor (sigma-70 family)